MAAQFSSRERTLAIAVGGILFLLVNLAVFRFVTTTRGRLQGDIAGKREEMAMLNALFEERDLWEQRSQWLAEHQPQLTNRDSAGVELLEEVKRVAQNNGVLLENPGFGSVEEAADRTSVPVNVETKSSWAALIGFLAELQAPEKFVVVENANLRVDGADATQMRGRLRIGKWYAPSGGK